MNNPVMDKQSRFQPAAFNEKILKEKFSTAVGKLAIGATVVFFGYMMIADHTPSAPEKPAAEIFLQP